MVNCGNHLRSGIICGGVQASFSFVPTPPRAVAPAATQWALQCLTSQTGATEASVFFYYKSQ